MTSFIEKLSSLEETKANFELRKNLYEFLYDILEDEDWDTQDEACEIDPAYDILFIEKWPHSELASELIASVRLKPKKSCDDLYFLDLLQV